MGSSPLRSRKDSRPLVRTCNRSFAARAMRMAELSSDIDHGQMFRLNPVGALILESLGRDGQKVNSLEKLLASPQVSEARAVADMREFLRSLEEHKLVRPRQAESIS